MRRASLPFQIQADLGLTIVEDGGDALLTDVEHLEDAKNRAAGRPVLVLGSDRENESMPNGAFPVHPERLGDWVRALAAVAATPEAHGADRPTDLEGWPGRRILVAEDISTNRLVIEKLLRRLDITPTFAPDGAKALEALEKTEFDLVLLDIEMPELDGYEVARRWREQEGKRGTRTPLIALTVHAMAGVSRRVLEAGMDELLMKPIRLHALVSALRRWLPNAGADRGSQVA